MYFLYSSPGTTALSAHAALEEIGAEYRVIDVDLAPPVAERDPALLEANPHGRVPTLIDGDVVVYEGVAVLMYLADRHPQAGLAPRADDRLRGPYYQWLAYMADTLQVAYQMHYYPERHSDDEGCVESVKAKAHARLRESWSVLEAALEPGPCLLGDRFSACDLHLHMLGTWHANHGWLLEEFPSVAAHARRVAARPAVARVLPLHGIGGAVG